MSVVPTQQGGEPVCCSLTAWCFHGQTCSRQNPSVFVGERGGGQTKGWNVPNCLVSISSSQWQGFPAVLISHTLSSGEQLACVHTHADPCHWFYNSYHLVCGIFPNSNLTASPWPRAHLWKEVQQKWLQHGPLIGNTRKDLTNEFTMRNAGGHRFQLVLNLPAVTKYTIFYLYVAITSHW